MSGRSASQAIKGQLVLVQPQANYLTTISPHVTVLGMGCISETLGPVLSKFSPFD